MTISKEFVAIGTNKYPTAADYIFLNNIKLVAFAAANTVALWPLDVHSSVSKNNINCTNTVAHTLQGSQNEITTVKFLNFQSNNNKNSVILLAGNDKGALFVWYLDYLSIENLNNFKLITQLNYANGSSITCIATDSSVNNNTNFTSYFLVTSADKFVRLFQITNTADTSSNGFIVDLKAELSIASSFYPLCASFVSTPHSTLIIAVAGSSKDIFVLTYFCSNSSSLSEISSVSTSIDSSNKLNLAATLKGHEDWVRSLTFTFSDNVYTLASASQDKYIRLWKFTHSTHMDTQFLKTTKDSISLDRFLLSKKSYKIPDKHNSSSSYYSCSFDALLIGHDDWVFSLAWRPGSNELLSASADTTVMIWAPEDNESQNNDEFSEGIWTPKTRLGDLSIKGATTATGASGGFWSAIWCGPNMLATSTKTGSWRIWTLESSVDTPSSTLLSSSLWNPKVGITGHFKTVTGLSWSPLDSQDTDDITSLYNNKESYLLTTSLDQTTRLWAPFYEKSSSKIIRWSEFSRPQIHGYDMICVAHTSSSQFVSGADEKIARVFDEPASIASTLNTLSNIPIPKSHLAQSAATIPTLGLSNKQDAEDNSSGTQETEKDSSNNDSSKIDSTLSRPPLDEELQRHTLWPEVDKLYGHGYEITTIDSTFGGDIIATACKANSIDSAVIRLFAKHFYKPTSDSSEIATWKEVKPSLEGHSLTITRVRFSPHFFDKGSYLLAVSRDRSFSVWHADSISSEQSNKKYVLETRFEKAHKRIIWDCAWIVPHNNALSSSWPLMFITVGRDKAACIWEKISTTNTKHSDFTWKLKSRVEFPDALTAVDVSPSSEKAVFGLADGTVVVLPINCLFEISSANKSSISEWDEVSIGAKIERLAWRNESQFAVAADGVYIFNVISNNITKDS